MQWESPKCLDPNLREIYGSDRSIAGSTDSKSKSRESECIICRVSLVETNRIIYVGGTYRCLVETQDCLYLLELELIVYLRYFCMLCVCEVEVEFCSNNLVGGM